MQVEILNAYLQLRNHISRPIMIKNDIYSYLSCLSYCFICIMYLDTYFSPVAMTRFRSACLTPLNFVYLKMLGPILIPPPFLERSRAHFSNLNFSQELIQQCMFYVIQIDIVRIIFKRSCKWYFFL
jgi:hypothetical protein